MLLEETTGVGSTDLGKVLDVQEQSRSASDFGQADNTGRGAERVRRTRGSHSRPETAVLRGLLAHRPGHSERQRVPTIPRTSLSGSLHPHCVCKGQGLC